MNAINRTARLTGLLYFIQLPLAIFGIMYVPMALVAPLDALVTMNNIASAEMTFRLSIGAALLVQVSHLIIVLLLYKILSPASRTAAVYMVVFMAVSVPITMLNELLNFGILTLVNAPPFLASFSSDQINSLVMLFHTLHEDGIFIAQIFWGLWLIPMAIMIIKSDFLPKILGYITLLVALSYTVDFFTGMLAPQFGIAFSETIGFLEVLFPLWLLIRGVNAEKWEQRRLASEG
jgi:hypothetical protein